MVIIRYSHVDHPETGDTRSKKILFSESPFPESNQKYFTDYIRISLPGGIFVCGHEKATPGYTLNTPTNDLYFHWCVSGKGTYNGIPFKANDVFVVHPGTQKQMVADSDDPWEIFWCVWKGSIANTVAGKLNNYDDNTVYNLENNIDLSGLFRFFIYQPHRERRISKIVSGFVDLLLSDCHIMQKNSNSSIKDARAKTIIEIQNYINNNFLDTNVEKVAQHFHYNRKYITRVFHEYTGITMCEYIREAKLHCAESYLLTTSMSVEEVAFRSGYSNYSSFIKAFKKKNGVTPTEFATLFS